jgi:putative DNA primase/helicase
MNRTHKAPAAKEIKKATKKVKRAKGKGEGKPNKVNGAALPPNSEPPDDATVFAEIERLAKLSVLAYQRAREGSAKSLELKVGMLDKLVEFKRTEATRGKALPEIKPWHQQVIGAELLDELAATYKRHVGLPTRGEEAAALWTLHAHCHDAADISPRFGITSSSPECGKSTLLRLIGDLVPRRLTASNITAAATFRAIEKWHPTLLIDEADTFLRDNDELRGVLNSSHSRSEAFVVRTTGDDYEPTIFSTWCPLVIAMIGSLPATLASRAIHIELQRLAKGEHVKPYRRAGPYTDLARKCARWAADNVEALRDADPNMEGIVNRAADNWRPLVAIADLAGDPWGGPTGKAREAILTLNQVDAGQTTAIVLLSDIRDILIELGEDDRVSSAELAKKLGEMEGRPWPEFGRSSKPITTNAIARLLKPFHVAPTKIRISNPVDGLSETVQGYYVEPLQAVFDRYLPPLS